jgi:serine/threonine-protein kinase HipA
MARRKPLQVWLYDQRVAELTTSGPGKIHCTYTKEAIGRWDLNVPLLSCSLPLRERRYADAAPFFRGLLPEGAALAAMASAARVPSYDTFGILARFGRDVAGAAVISDEPGAVPQQGSVVPYDEAYLAQEVGGLDERPLALHEDSELSLPGLQNKLLLVRTETGWGRPAGGFPSTHILKVEDRRFPGLVVQEASALALARAIGLTTVRPEVVEYANMPCLIVDRFDRATATVRSSHAATAGRTPTPSRRIHQEDVCQATGVNAEAAHGQAKYQFAGGPGFADVASLLERFSADPSEQLDRLLAVAVFTVAIGNADAHGKNVALLHIEPGVVELAPLYDTVPTALFPTLRTDAAMQVNARMSLADVTGGDLVAEAVRWRVSANRARAVITRTMDALAAATEEKEVTDGLAALVQRRCHHLRATLS